MQNKNFFSILTGKIPRFHLQLNRTKLLLFALTLVAFGLALGGLESGGDEQLAVNKVISLDLPDRQDFQFPPTEISDVQGAGASFPDTLAQGEQWDHVTVRPGQTLDAIFRQQGFSLKTLQKILALNKDTRQLKKIRPGDLFEFQRHEDKSLKRMRYAIDEAIT